MKKKCTKCGIIKPLIEFDKSKLPYKFGCNSQCKECRKKYFQERRKTKEFKTKDKIWRKEYRKKPEYKKYAKEYEQYYTKIGKGKEAQAKYRKTEKYKTTYKIKRKEYLQSERGKAYIRKWNKERVSSGRGKVYGLVNYIKPKKKPCKICNTTKRLHAHHPDYSKPLDIIWLCALHHKQVHMKKITIRRRQK